MAKVTIEINDDPAKFGLIHYQFSLANDDGSPIAEEQQASMTPAACMAIALQRLSQGTALRDLTMVWAPEEVRGMLAARAPKVAQDTAAPDGSDDEALDTDE